MNLSDEPDSVLTIRRQRDQSHSRNHTRILPAQCAAGRKDFPLRQPDDRELREERPVGSHPICRDREHDEALFRYRRVQAVGRRNIAHAAVGASRQLR